MKAIIDRANDRGHVQHGWLDTYHSFSFADYYNPQKMRFGALRVINEDTVQASEGFGKHSHADMEIITLVLSGELEHQDSMGNKGVITKGEVQIMSAGTGIMHSEYNATATDPVHFLQIWVYPNQRSVEPRYQKTQVDLTKRNELQQVVCPDKESNGWLHQEAWFHVGQFDQGKKLNYPLHSADHGLYVFVIDGTVKFGEHELGAKDALGLVDCSEVELDVQQDSYVLLIEVPMHF